MRYGLAQFIVAVSVLLSSTVAAIPALAENENISFGELPGSIFAVPAGSAVPSMPSPRVSASAPNKIVPPTLSPELLQASNQFFRTFKTSVEKTEPQLLDPAQKALARFCGRKNLTDASKILTLRIIEEIVSHAQCTTGISKSEQAHIALALLRDVASPVVYINQVGKTCLLAAYEVRLATLYPELYASLVMQVALTGQFKCVDGSVLVYPMNSFSNKDTSSSGNWANRLFEVTVCNIAWSNQTERPDRYKIEAKAGCLRYELEGNKGALKDYSRDKIKGEPIYWSFGGRIESPALDFKQQDYINRMVCGRSEIIQLAPKGTSRSNPPGVYFYSNRAELKQFLEYTALGKMPGVQFPLMIVVDGKRLERADANPGLPAKGTHEVTIMSYIPATGKVELNNTWGNDNDWVGQRAISLQELWGVMPAPELDNDDE